MQALARVSLMEATGRTCGEALSGVGFVDVAIVHATCGFVTWMARKPHAPPSTVEDGARTAPHHANSVLFFHGHRPSGHSSDVKHLFRRPEQGNYDLDGKPPEFPECM